MYLTYCYMCFFARLAKKNMKYEFYFSKTSKKNFIYINILNYLHLTQVFTVTHEDVRGSVVHVFHYSNV